MAIMWRERVAVAIVWRERVAVAIVWREGVAMTIMWRERVAVADVWRERVAMAIMWRERVAVADVWRERVAVAIVWRGRGAVAYANNSPNKHHYIGSAYTQAPDIRLARVPNNGFYEINFIGFLLVKNTKPSFHFTDIILKFEERQQLYFPPLLY